MRVRGPDLRSWVRLRRRRADSSQGKPEGPPPPSRDLIVFLREAGLALCASGDATNRVTGELEDLAARYGATGVRFFVLPTGVFVRIGEGEDTTLDFAPVDRGTLRLDQIARLHELLEEARRTKLDPREGTSRLSAILHSAPRFSPQLTIVAQVLLTIGLGLIRNPVPSALIGYAVLGALVGALRILADRFRVLSLALPALAALLVAVVALTFPGELADGDPTPLLIPPLVMFLPGAALTIGTIELATGAMVSGAARLMYAFNVLFLLAFGIFAGAQLVGFPHVKPETAALGWWAPWVGVLLVGIGFFVDGSAPARSLPWLLVALYLVWGAQFTGNLMGSGLLGAFLGGLVVTPIAYAVQGRRNGPPTQVTFLPAFWLLVPGALGLAGVSELVNSDLDVTTGLLDVVTTLVTVIAIALGVLVGSSLTRSSPAPGGRPIDSGL